jgi:hypothetical protein
LGGIGSGRKYYGDAKDTVDSCYSIDIHYLARNGLLLPGRSISLTWSSSTRKKASIEVQTTAECLILNYKVNGESICDHVPIIHTPCHYGGNRPWLQCPKCDRRVGKVHLNGKHFRCRHCYNLAYQSQRENAACRQLNRLKTIGKRLGGSIDIFGSMPVKPKGMHRNTYMRLLGQSHIMLLSVSQAISKQYKSKA